jgi:Raf kinase inhibitor-like YbhB/YbcL family protein
MLLTSTAFQQGSSIPKRYTCEGENNSPDISWSDAPKGTVSFVLLLHDPDAPRPGGFTHWAVYNIPATVGQITEHAPAKEILEGIGMQGVNDAGKIGYMGPCPPSGEHRYFFYLYALRDDLKLGTGVSHIQVRSAMEELVIEHTELMGTCKKTAEKAA